MEFDALVIGGGPAGLAAAFFLSDSDIRVGVVERLSTERYDRYHSICGEGISNDAFLDLRPMEPWGIKNHISKATLIWPDEKEIDVPVKGYIIDRPTFLQELRDRCSSQGVEFIEGSARDITENEDGYVVTLRDGREIRCRYLVGADGAWSIVRKKLFDSVPTECRPVKHYVTRNSGVDSLRVYLNDKYGGSYRWEFPSGENMTVGFAKGYDSVDDFITEDARYLPFGGVGDIVKGNAFLLGDAAAMSNPVSFGGLKAALLSGKKCAQAISKESPRSYQRWWDRSILSSKRFMAFHEKLQSWSNDDMIKAVKPFSNRFLIPSALWAVISRPWNIGMYIGCLFAFKFSW